MAAKPEDLEWEPLRHFLAAARERSLSGAARRLGVEHSTVGRRIASLEQSLGAALVERGPAGLELTRLGTRVARLAKEMEHAAQRIAKLASAKRSTVRLVAPTGFLALLSPGLARLRKAEPGVALEIVSAGRRVDLRNGAADLAIRVGPSEDEHLVTRKVGEVAFALYAARSYLDRHGRPADLDDLSEHSVVGFQRGLSKMPAAEWLASRSSKATVVMRSREAVDLLTAVQSGAGLGVLPCFLARGDASLERLTAKPVALRPVSLVYRREARLSPQVRAVMRFVVEALRARARELNGER
ncbi:MAG TPA: LysR family transcriptional regulator [Polyangiaceae bacterium]|nr:LysR family transcriptional regulator [Polyangiaceae bacterium]